VFNIILPHLPSQVFITYPPLFLFFLNPSPALPLNNKGRGEKKIGCSPYLRQNGRVPITIGRWMGSKVRREG